MKLYCIVSEEAVKAAGGSRGKMAAQCGHGFVHSLLDCMERFPDRATRYLKTSTVGKIVLIAPDELLPELRSIYAPVCGVYLVRDAGLTVFKEPTQTCLGIGPLEPDEREDILKGLRPWQ